MQADGQMDLVKLIGAFWKLFIANATKTNCTTVNKVTSL
jgi:hypothetical protein